MTAGLDAVLALGEEISPAASRASGALYREAHHAQPRDDVDVDRDLSYGPDGRQRLDLFAPEDAADGRPVLVFVHGGNFVGGDKTDAEGTYYDNVGYWAARRGFIGVPMTYRLAPEHQWPAGTRDVGAAVDWLRGNVDRWGGDPTRIVLAGASAGAVHVATYVAGRGGGSGAGNGSGVCGAALISGIYEAAAFGNRSVLCPYLGDDEQTWAPASTLADLPCLGVPLRIAVAEFDPPSYHEQALLAINALACRGGRLPHVAYVAGHNHLTEIHHLGAEPSVLDAHLESFIRFATRGSGREGESP